MTFLNDRYNNSQILYSLIYINNCCLINNLLKTLVLTKYCHIYATNIFKQLENRQKHYSWMRFELFFSEVRVCSGVSTNCGKSMGGIALSNPLSWARQGTWKENLGGQAVSDCMESISQASWEARWSVGARLWHRPDLHSKGAPLSVFISYCIHPHQLLWTTSWVTPADNSNFWYSDHKSLFFLPLNQKNDGIQGRSPFENVVMSSHLFCKYKIFLSHSLKTYPNTYGNKGTEDH